MKLEASIRLGDCHVVYGLVLFNLIKNMGYEQDFWSRSCRGRSQAYFLHTQPHLDWSVFIASQLGFFSWWPSSGYHPRPSNGGCKGKKNQSVGAQHHGVVVWEKDKLMVCGGSWGTSLEVLDAHTPSGHHRRGGRATCAALIQINQRCRWFWWHWISMPLLFFLIKAALILLISFHFQIEFWVITLARL